MPGLSRIPLMVPHIVEGGLGVWRRGAWHVGTSSGSGRRRGVAGFAGVGAFGASGRSGSGAGDRAVGERLDERTDWSGVRSDSGQRTTVAELVCGRWRRWTAGGRATGAGAGEGRGRGGGRRGLAQRAGRGSAELDLAASASRGRPTDRGDDLQVTAQQGAKKKAFAGAGRGTAWAADRMPTRSTAPGCD